MVAAVFIFLMVSQYALLIQGKEQTGLQAQELENLQGEVIENGQVMYGKNNHVHHAPVSAREQRTSDIRHRTVNDDTLSDSESGHNSGLTVGVIVAVIFGITGSITTAMVCCFCRKSRPSPDPEPGSGNQHDQSGKDQEDASKKEEKGEEDVANTGHQPTGAGATETTPLLRNGQKKDEKPEANQLSLIKYKDDNGETQRIQVIESIAVKWFDVGLNLSITEEKLGIIKETERNDPTKCARAMLREWLQSGQEPTWAKLIEALEDSELPALAQDLKIALPRMKKD